MIKAQNTTFHLGKRDIKAKFCIKNQETSNKRGRESGSTDVKETIGNKVKTRMANVQCDLIYNYN